MAKKLIAAGSRYFLAALFIFAATDKLFHYQGFIKALGNYVLVPHGAAEYLALPIILTEVWIGAGLIVRPWRTPAGLLATGLMLMFTCALTLNYVYAPRSVCGCWFSITLGTATITHIVANLFLVGLSITVWLDARSVDSPRSSVPNPKDRHEFQFQNEGG